MEIKTIILECIAQKRIAQKRLYEMYYGKLMVVCRRYSKNRDEALEILNNGFLKIFNNLEKFQKSQDQNFDAWAAKIMVNTAIDFYRAELRHQSEEVNTSLYVEDSQNILDDIAVQEIMEMISLLPTSYRTCFNLFVIDGYSHKEIAELLQIQEGTSKSNLAKARAKLQIMLSKKKQIDTALLNESYRYSKEARAYNEDR